MCRKIFLDIGLALGGATEFVWDATDLESAKTKLSRQIRRALQPPLQNARIEWDETLQNDYEVVQTPDPMVSFYSDDLVRVYALLRNEPEPGSSNQSKKKKKFSFLVLFCCFFFLVFFLVFFFCLFVCLFERQFDSIDLSLEKKRSIPKKSLKNVAQKQNKKSQKKLRGADWCFLWVIL